MSNAQDEARLAFHRKQYEARSQRSTGMAAGKPKPKDKPKTLFEAVKGALTGRNAVTDALGGKK